VREKWSSKMAKAPRAAPRTRRPEIPTTPFIEIGEGDGGGAGRRRGRRKKMKEEKFNSNFIQFKVIQLGMPP